MKSENVGGHGFIHLYFKKVFRETFCVREESL